MSNIQQNLNQMLTTVGVAARLSPVYKQGIEARESVGKAKAAQAGLTEIEEHLKDPKKQYARTELEDIASRYAEHNRNIHSAKTLALSNKYADIGLENAKAKGTILPQEQYSKLISSIETSLSNRFSTLENQKEGLAQRKLILDAKGHPIGEEMNE